MVLSWEPSYEDIDDISREVILCPLIGDMHGNKEYVQLCCVLVAFIFLFIKII